MADYITRALIVFFIGADIGIILVLAKNENRLYLFRWYTLVYMRISAEEGIFQEQF